MMHFIDLAIIAAYLVITLVVGLSQGRNITSMKDYAIADRNYPTPIMVAAIFATLIGGENTMGMAEKIFQVGPIFLFIFLGNAIGKFIIAGVIAPRMQKFDGMLSVGEMMGSVYGKIGTKITGLAGTILLIGALGAQVSALGYFISFFIDIPFFAAVLLGSGIVITYCAFGGIKAVTFTDVIQFGVLLVAIPMICNVSLNTVGGYDVLLDSLPESHLHLIPAGESPWKYIWLVLLFSIPFLDPAKTQRLLMCKDPQQIKTAMRISACVEIPFYWMVTIIGLSALVLFPEISGAHAIPKLITEVLPIGLKGLTIAGMMAVIMSTADSVLNAASVTFVHDVVKPSYKKPLTPQKELKIAKIASVIFGLLSIAMALSANSIVDILLNALAVWGPVIVVPLYAVIFGVPANSRIFIKSIIAGLGCFILWKVFNVEDILGFDGLVPSIFANGIVFFTCVHRYKKKNDLQPPPTAIQQTTFPSLTQKVISYLKKKTGGNKKIQYNLLYALKKRLEEIDPPFIAFGIFGLINYVIPHFMWDISKPDDFILYFRSCAGLLVVMLILKNYWPSKTEHYLPLVWYGTLLFCLPFLATYAAFLNQGEIWWVMNLCLSIFILGTLVDWESFLWLLCLGTSAGYIFSSSQFPIIINLPKEAIYPSTYILLISIIAGLFFSRRRESLQIARQKTLEAAAGAIAHEMRTPLASVSMNGHLLKRSLEKIQNHFIHTKQDENFADKTISPLNQMADSLISVSKHSNNLINVLLTNLKEEMETLPQSDLSMKDVLQETLQEFTYRPHEKEKIHITIESDFIVKGNPEIVTHVFYNLLKNSLYFIHACGKGEVFITLKQGRKGNMVLFKDTGPGVEPKRLPKLFTPFYSRRPHGTGIGLSFCKRAIESMGGTIKVDSILNDHTIFTIILPYDKEV